MPGLIPSVSGEQGYLGSLVGEGVDAIDDPNDDAVVLLTLHLDDLVREGRHQAGDRLNR